jgi:hypothetical protein
MFHEREALARQDRYRIVPLGAWRQTPILSAAHNYLPGAADTSMMRSTHNIAIRGMAKLSDLIQGTSDITGVPVPTVRELSRRLRESGLISTGKGGRYGGAEMTPADAGGLLTALMIAKTSSVSLNRIVPLTKTYLRGLRSHSGLRLHSGRGYDWVFDRWKRQLGLAELCRLKEGHTFEEAIVGLISSMSNSNFELTIPKWGSVNVELEVFDSTPVPAARLSFYTTNFGILRLHYIPHRLGATFEGVPYKSWHEIPVDYQVDLRARALITEATLKTIGLVLSDYERLNV